MTIDTLCPKCQHHLEQSEIAIFCPFCGQYRQELPAKEGEKASDAAFTTKKPKPAAIEA